MLRERLRLQYLLLFAAQGCLQPTADATRDTSGTTTVAPTAMVATAWTAGPEAKQLGRSTDAAVLTYVVRAAAEEAVPMLATWMRFQIRGGIQGT